MDRKNLFKPLVYLVFFILLANFCANTFYWYSAIWYLDMFMHFLGGFWIGLLFFYLFPLKENISCKLCLKTLFFVLLIGVGWEVFELLINDVIAQNSFDLLDTVSDLFFDLSGGLCAILYIWKKLQKKQLK